MKAATTQSSSKTTMYLFAAAFIARIAVLLANAHVLTEVPTFDAGRYDTIARHLLASGEYIFDGQRALTSPLYPLFLAGIYLIPGPERLYVCLAQIVLGALTVVMIYRTALYMFSNRAAVVAALIAAFYPPFMFICIRTLTEALFVPLVAAGLLYTVRMVKSGGIKNFALAGLWTGLACLTRPLVFYFPLVLTAAMFLVAHRKKTSFPLRGLAVFLLIFYLCNASWAVRNYIALGQPVWTSSNVGELLLISQMPRYGKFYGFNLKESDLAPEERYKLHLPELERSAALKELAIHYVLDNPQELPRLMALKTIYLLSPFDWEILGNTGGTFNPVFLLLLPLCLFGAIRAGVGNIRSLPLGLLLYFIAFSYVTYSSPRFRMPMELIIITFAGFGWTELEDSRPLFSRWRYQILGLIFLALIAGHIWAGAIKQLVHDLLVAMGLW